MRRSITSLRRQLQREHLSLLAQMVVTRPAGTPEDATMMAWDELRYLRTEMASARRRSRDEYTRVHLAESLMRVERALDAKQVIGAPAAATPNILQMLLGGNEAAPAR